MIHYELFDVDDVLEDLENNPTEEARLEILDKYYPILYVWLLRKRGRNEAATRYLAENKQYS